MYTAVSGQSTLADNLAYHVFEGGCFFVCQLCAELEPKSWTNGHLAAHMAYWCMLGIVKGPQSQQGWHLHSARCECNPSATGWAAAMVWLKYCNDLNTFQQINMRKKKISKKRRKNQESLLSPLLLASCSHIGSEARILTWPRPKKDVEHRVGTQNNMSWQHRFPMFSRYCRSEKHSNTPKPASGPLSSLCSWCLSRRPFLPFPSERQLLGMGRWWEMHTHELFPSKCVTFEVDADSPSHLLSLEVCGKRRARIKCLLVAV